MSGSPAGFDSAMVGTALTGTRFAGSLQHLSSVGSTNALALQAAANGAETGAWVADEQTAGRGRGGHTWHSAPGDGLYLSALIRPRLSSARALSLSLAAGLAAQQALIEVADVRIDLRWPNDLMLHGKKCGGILVEAATEPVRGESKPAHLRYAVIGIGINLHHAAFPAELAGLATSLLRETGRTVDRGAVCAAVLRALDREVAELEREDAATLNEPRPVSVLSRFAECSTWVRGKRVVVEDRYTGTTDGLTAEGFLRVCGEDGDLRVVRSGGVRELSPGAPEGHT